MLLALVLAAAPLPDAMSRYADLDYEGCVGALAPAVGKLRGASRAQAELYLGLCQFALGREGEARRHLEAALRLDAEVKPPASASPKERALFDEVSRAVAASPRPPPRPRAAKKASEGEAEPEPEPATAEPAPAPAPTDAPVAEPAPAPAPPPPPPTPPPQVEAPPRPRSFGVPLALTAVALAGGGVATAFGLLAGQTAQQAQREPVQVPSGALASRAQTYALVTNVALGLAGAVALAALITWLWTGLASQ